jgi:2-amino-4-hydroxy-6-hydroxymethyldihydropteridine diphosphokinase
MERVYLGIGSNLGNRAQNIQRATQILSDHTGIKLLRKSALRETEPQGNPNQPRFLNGVLEIETSLEPVELLSVLQQIERQLGRDHKHRPDPRTIDLDILFYGSRVCNVGGLVIPHPRLWERRFVLDPLNDLIPDFIHPVLGKSVSELRRRLGSL